MERRNLVKHGTASKLGFQSRPKILETFREKLVQHCLNAGCSKLHASKNRFAASPGRTFDGEARSMITYMNTGEKIQLDGQYLVDIKKKSSGTD